jgi:hypothetical protein
VSLCSSSIYTHNPRLLYSAQGLEALNDRVSKVLCLFFCTNDMQLVFRLHNIVYHPHHPACAAWRLPLGLQASTQSQHCRQQAGNVRRPLASEGHLSTLLLVHNRSGQSMWRIYQLQKKKRNSWCQPSLKMTADKGERMAVSRSQPPPVAPRCGSNTGATEFSLQPLGLRSSDA